MLAEIISIGDELTSGQRLDTNSQWLAQQLVELGIRPAWHTTVTDDLQANIEVFQVACRRADIVISTGGLGPTLDDLTRQAIAEAFQLSLLEEPRAIEHIVNLFARRQRPMPERNRVQALLPQGSRMIDNPQGTAPGIDLAKSRPTGGSFRIFALPGVPAEMKQMWEQSVAPRLISECGAGERNIVSKTLKCFGIGESEVESRMPDLIHRDRQPRVGITVSRATISLRIVAEGADIDHCHKQIAATEREIREKLGAIVFGEGDQELHDVILATLKQRQESIACVEVGSTSLLPLWLSIPSSADETPYRGSSHLRYLPENKSLQQLAEQQKEIHQATWGLALGCYPDWEQLHANSTTHIFPITVAIAGPASEVTTFPMSGHPEVIQHRIAKAALDRLRYLLMECDQ